MTHRLTLAAAAALTASVAWASSNDIGFNPVAAGHHCEDLADSYQVLDEDRRTYLSRCVAEYRESPPGGEGADVSPHAAGY
jgi:hypothetical protein